MKGEKDYLGGGRKGVRRGRKEKRGPAWGVRLTKRVKTLVWEREEDYPRWETKE